MACRFSITSGLRFFEQAHVKDVAAFLKFAVNPRDEVAFKRMARLLPGIGARSAESAVGRRCRRRQWRSGGGAGGGRAAADAFHSQLLQPLKVPAKAAKAWQQLAHTLEELAPGGKPNPPAEMIASVVEAIYDDYAKAKFPNYDQRREDLNTLANFAKQYEKRRRISSTSSRC